MAKLHLAEPYELVAYPSYARPQTHARRLATIAWLRGLEPPALEGCRVVEVGCGAGGNLIPMAAGMPESQFLGVDFSVRAIAQARAIASTLELTNIEFRQQDLRDLADNSPSCDYLIAHGVFSWIPADAREHLLRWCGHMLSDRGIAFISYNCYPGWGMRGMLREFLLSHTSQYKHDIRQHIAAVRRLFEWLPRQWTPEHSPYHPALLAEIQRLATLDDGFLAHDILAPINDCFTLRDFVDRAATHGLQYLGDADFCVMEAGDLPHDLSASLRESFPDAVEFGQQLDYLRWQHFRQTLLCRSERTLMRDPTVDRWQALWYATSADVVAETPTDGLETEVTFTRQATRMSTRSPLIVAAMRELRAAWPRSISYEQLFENVAARLVGDEASAPMGKKSPAYRELAEALGRAHATTLVDASWVPPPVCANPSDRPRALRTAQAFAAISPNVPNAWHASVTLPSFPYFLLSQLDGHSSREELIDRLCGAPRGTFTLTDEKSGQPIADPSQIRTVLGRLVDETFDQFTELGLWET